MWKGLLAILIPANTLSVFLAANGVERLVRAGCPPFHGASMYHIIAAFPFPPDFIVLAVASALGRIVMWMLALLAPLAAVYSIVVWQRLWTAVILAGVVTLTLGFFGIWIWLHAIFNSALF
jgi:hypothetical protein